MAIYNPDIMFCDKKNAGVSWPPGRTVILNQNSTVKGNAVLDTKVQSISDEEFGSFNDIINITTIKIKVN